MQQNPLGRRLCYLAVTVVVIGGLVGGVRWVKLATRDVNHGWNVVSVGADRRSIVIRVNECRGTYAAMKARRIDRDVKITVYERRSSGEVDCTSFDNMPTHIVRLGDPLPRDGRVLGGCPNNDCG